VKRMNGCEISLMHYAREVTLVYGRNVRLGEIDVDKNGDMLKKLDKRANNFSDVVLPKPPEETE